MSFSSKITTMVNIIKNSRLALIAKGETVTYDNYIPDIIAELDTGESFKALLERRTTTIVLPNNLRYIADYAFYYFVALHSITIPEGVIDIGNYAFFKAGSNTGEETGIIYTLPNSLRTIGQACFAGIDNMYSVTIPEGVIEIGTQCFFNCKWLYTIYLPSTLTTLGNNILVGCLRLSNVTLGNGFNCNGLNLSVSTNFSPSTIESGLNALADRTGDTAYTLIIGSTNLAKLTAEQIAIATNKNWNLA